jgi:beta-glucosidase
MLLPAGLLALSGLLLVSVRADVITRIPDAAPAGFEEWISPIVCFPSPCLCFPAYSPKIATKNVSGDGDWASAVAKARAFVAQLTLAEKVNLTTGIGINGRCVGNTGVSSESSTLSVVSSPSYVRLQEVTRLGFKGLCLEDSPLGVRDTDFASALYVVAPDPFCPCLIWLLPQPRWYQCGRDL